MSDPLPTLPGIIDSHAHVHSGDLAADLAGVLDRARAGTAGRGHPFRVRGMSAAVGRATGESRRQAACRRG